MLFTTIFTLLFPMVVLATPVALDVHSTNPCAPTSYTLSDYIFWTSSSDAGVEFDFKSTFAAGVIIEDVVTSGATCHAEGVSIPNNNECDVEKRRLLFDLRGPQDTAHYQITHTWVCNGATWMSGTDVTVTLDSCYEVNGVKTCSGEDQQIVPQNVRQICSTPTC